MTGFVRAGVVLIIMLAAPPGCRRKQPAPPPPPPAAVTVARPIQRDVLDWDEYTGYLAAPETVELRARVSGMVVDAPFAEGRIVRKGDLLYELDARPFQAELDARLADVQRAEATVANRQADYDRQVEALQANAVPQQQVDDAKAMLLGAQADVAAARAAAEAARLNVEFCRVTSPIDGRAGKRNVTPGNLITGGQGTGTLLTTIVSVDPVHLYVEVDEGSVLKYQRLAMEQRRVSARDARITVYMQLANETGFPHEGVIDFVDNRVDPGTGTLQARGVFPNPGGFLTPGFFGRMRIPGSGQYTALLVPDSAIGTSQDVKFVLTVGQDDVVQYRKVTLGSPFGQLRAIVDGIGPDDRVVVNGLMRARLGATVKPEERPIDPAMFTDAGRGPTAVPSTAPATGPAPAPSLTPPTAVSNGTDVPLVEVPGLSTQPAIAEEPVTDAVPPADAPPAARESAPVDERGPTTTAPAEAADAAPDAATTQDVPSETMPSSGDSAPTTAPAIDVGDPAAEPRAEPTTDAPPPPPVTVDPFVPVTAPAPAPAAAIEEVTPPAPAPDAEPVR